MRTLLTLSVVSCSLFVAQADVRVVVPRADLRAEPSASAPLLTSVSYGAAIQMKSEQNGWARVLVPDARLSLPDARVEGWIPACAIHAELACAAPKSNIAVSADVPGQSHWLNPVALRAVPVPDSSSSLKELTSSPTLTTALAGETKAPADTSTTVTWVWTMAQSASVAALKLSGQPTFLAIYHDIPGLQAEAFAPAIVRVAPASMAGVVSKARGRADAASRYAADWMLARDLTYDVVSTTPLGGNVGMVKVRPAAALTPGVYALVLRPMYLTGYAGARVFTDDREGLAFGQAWPFQVR